MVEDRSEREPKQNQQKKKGNPAHNKDLGSWFPNIEVYCDDCCDANQVAQDPNDSPANVLSHISWST